MAETAAPSTPASRGKIWMEAIGFWLITAIAIRAAVELRLSDSWVSVVKSLALIYLPLAWIYFTRRDFARYGLTVSPMGPGAEPRPARSARLGPSLKLFAIVSLATLVPFWIGTTFLAPFWDSVGFLATHRFSLRFPPSAAALIAGEVLAIALPEEVFYRGYLQTRLDEVLPKRIRILGADVGWAIPITSVIFVAGHMAVSPALWQLSIFFPSLVFGWMRVRTGSLVAPVLYHALCNLSMLVLQLSFGR